MAERHNAALSGAGSKQRLPRRANNFEASRYNQRLSRVA
jgi:hypothetical protein